MRKVMDEAEEEKRKQEDKQKRYKDNLRDNQSFVLSQMRKAKDTSPAAVAWKAKALMNEDEVRYNRDILEKLAQMRN
jgi:predicted transcriptional regulator